MDPARLLGLAAIAGAGALLLVGGRREPATVEQGEPGQGGALSTWWPWGGETVSYSDSAAALDWSRIEHFGRDEFFGKMAAEAPSEIDMAPFIHASVVEAADKLREAYGRPLIVSPAPGAIVRDYGSATSQHHVDDLDGDELGRALDLLVPSGDLLEVYQAAEAVPELRAGGVGLYPDWKPHPGIHIDTRGERARWMAVNEGDRQAYGALDLEAVRQRLAERGMLA